MYTAWLFFEDQFRDVFFPDKDSWISSIVLSQFDTGWERDAVFSVRLLEKRLYLSIPPELSWHDGYMNLEREVPIDTYFQLLRNGAKVINIIIRRMDRSQLCFTKYCLAGSGLSIGRDNSADICCAESVISAPHGFISMRDGDIQYADNSSNGTYLNGRMVHNTAVQLHFGDVLTFPSGFKIVMLGDCIALNCSASLKRVNLRQVSSRPVSATADEPSSWPQAYCEYHRTPRILNKAEPAEIEIESPPQKQNQRQPPVWLQIGPSATMVLPMVIGTIAAGIGTGTSGFAARGVSSIAMIGTSSLLAVMWSSINRKYRQKDEAEAEQQRISLYQKYIAEMEGSLKSLNEREYRRLCDTFPNVGQCALIPQNLSTHLLWNRMPTHPDFLEVRLGTGDVDLPGDIETQKQKLNFIDDPLRNEPERLLRVYSVIADAPFTVKLRSETVVGILGGDEAVLFAQGMLMQIAALHSYHDVRIAVLTDETSTSQWEWVRWLPHVFTNEDREMRMVASKPASIHDVMNHIDEVLAMRSSLEEESTDAQQEEELDVQALPLPHYIIFCTNYRLLENEPVMRKLLTRHLGTTLVMVVPSMEMLPKETHQIINLTQKPGLLHYSEGDTRTVDFEYPNRNLLRTFARSIAPVRVHDAVESAAIPTLVSFLDIYGVRHVDDLDVWRLWSENRTYDGLRSTIGYTAGSRPFILDISEKYHGPHGLIAGTTGSGKSVMLQTYILSLALNYSPEEIQFILIDYKGGGMADSFRNLPHVVGIIDNLQGEQVIRRALASLNGEIHRREVLFKQVKVKDITEYSLQYGSDPEAVKLPHLIIIADEFAELKSDQPEFMKELVSASRVGRSLGVHLILATQKPAGSVSDEIWANSRFHLCLRVQTVADSRDMLKRPDAAYIKGTGRCFIQIGNDESFDQVQTSYAGLPYDPNVPRPEEMPRLLGEIGQSITVPKRQVNKAASEKTVTQMDAVLARISDIAKDHHLDHQRQMWLPEMPAHIYFNELPLFADNCMRGEEYANCPEGAQFLLGLADDTANQRYLPLIINLSEIRNLLIVGLAGSGKTTAVQSIAYSLANQYDPEHLNMYVLSLTSQTLNTLTTFPHVGDIVFENNVIEIRRFFNMLFTEAQRRSELFSSASTDSFIEYNRSRVSAGASPVPAIVVFVDRFEQLKTMFENDDATMGRIASLIHEGSSRGIHFIVTALAKNEVPYKLHPFFNGIALQLSDRSDYSDVLNKRVPIEQPPIARNPGRCLSTIGGTIYEIQIGLAGGSLLEPSTETFAGFDAINRYAIEMPFLKKTVLQDIERADQITVFARRQDERWHGARPARIPRIPEEPDWQKYTSDPKYVQTRELPFEMPVGYDLNSGELTTLDLEENFSLFITGPKRSGRTNLLMFLARVMLERGTEVHVIGDTEWVAFAKETGVALHSTPQEIVDFTRDFAENVLNKRTPLKREAKRQGKSALRRLALSLSPITIIVDNAQRFNTDFNGLEQGKDLTMLREVYSQLCAKADHYNFQLFFSAPFTAASFFMQEPLRSLIAQGRGISLGGKVSDCNPLGIASIIPPSVGRKALPTGQGYLVTEGKLSQIVIPYSGAADE